MLHGPAVDVLNWLHNADAQLAQAERTLASAVTRARQAGHSWATIGTQLNITRQAAQQRFRTSATPTRVNDGDGASKRL